MDLADELGIPLSQALDVIHACEQSTSSIPPTTGDESANTGGTTDGPTPGNIVSQSVSAKDLITIMQSEKPIISFCRELDSMLGGGIARGQLTEFCGVPGVSVQQPPSSFGNPIISPKL